MVWAPASRTASVSAASALIASAFPPAASIERTTSLALSGDALYVRATAAPSVASRLAIAAPMLREPPVTSATLPASLPASFFVMLVLIIFFLFGRGLAWPARWETCKFALRSKPVVEITSMTSALLEPDFIGALCDFGAQIRGLWSSGGVVCFLSRSVFHCSALFMVFLFLCASHLDDSWLAILRK